MNVPKIAISLLLLSVTALPKVAASAAGPELPDYGALDDFSLIERSGEPFRLKDMLGMIWIADFIFTRCSGPCPLLSTEMSALQKKLSRDVGFLSFSVDPDYDSPAILNEYAAGYGAETGRWLFLTGDRSDMYRLIREGFHIGVDPNRKAKSAGEAFIHSQRFVLVDGNGKIRGYYDGIDRDDLKRLSYDVAALKFERQSGLVKRLPTVNAALNLTSAILLIAGFRFIRMKKVTPHKVCMVLAFFASSLFLVSYLVYHAHVGSVPYRGEGLVRTAYFAILISHVVLAVLVVPLALVTLYRAWKQDFERHMRIARWALPVWLYVSVTGVMVYWMLYLV